MSKIKIIIASLVALGLVASIGFYTNYYKTSKLPEQQLVTAPKVDTNSNSTTSSSVVTTPTTTRTDSVNVIYYKNQNNGFMMKLPSTWSGYKLSYENITGTMLDGSNKQQTVGILIHVMHPKSFTSSNPDTERQDIPVMVIIKSDWDLIQSEKMSVSAAPFPPSEIGRNDYYVFALPPRWNFAQKTGYEEVSEIVKDKDFFKAFNLNTQPQSL